MKHIQCESGTIINCEHVMFYDTVESKNGTADTVAVLRFPDHQPIYITHHRNLNRAKTQLF